LKPIYRCLKKTKYVEDPSECEGDAILLLEPAKRISLSKLMTAVLRHIPHEAGLVLDKEGWIDIDKLVEGIRRRWAKYSWVQKEHVEAVAFLDSKGRFEVQDSKIRARYGHSFKVNIAYEKDNSALRLYHGTPVSNLPKILREGLKPGKRLWVHLSIDPLDDVETGLRHGTPVALLEVDRDCLRRHGYEVFKASQRVRVVKEVPPDCLRVVNISSRRAR
jgi:putative RNA 2'-phosphotransferase